MHGFTSFWLIGWNVFDFVVVAVTLLGQRMQLRLSPSVNMQLTLLFSVIPALNTNVVRVFRILRLGRALRSLTYVSRFSYKGKH